MLESDKYKKTEQQMKQPINASVAAYHMVESPSNGPDWQLQCQLQFLFPK
jgi:hypothetical protein